MSLLNLILGACFPPPDAWLHLRILRLLLELR